MKVQEVVMMNVIGDLSYVDNVISDVLDTGKVEIVPALDQIEDGTFILNVTDENIEKSIDLNFTHPFKKNDEIKLLLEKADNLVSLLGLDLSSKTIDASKNYKAADIHSLFESLHAEFEKVEELNNGIETSVKNRRNVSLFKDLDVNLEDLEELKYFDYKTGFLSKDDRLKLKKNYGNILAGVFHTGTSEEGEVYLILYPKSYTVEMERMLRSLNWMDIDLPKGFKGTPKQVLTELEATEKQLLSDKNAIMLNLESIKKSKGQDITGVVKAVYNESKVDSMKQFMATSEKFFYMAGWVAKNDMAAIKQKIGKYPDIYIEFREVEDVPKLQPPTKFSNNFIVKPFEMLVKMYGVPNYKELDPTLFFGVTYMILFGAMFGDVGQGAIIALAGYLLSRKIKSDFGPLLIRLGLSSVVFGFLYGSIFGNEELIPAFWISPYHANMNTMFGQMPTVLVLAIAFGILLLALSYIFGFYNKYRNHDIEEGLFGKEGVAGFLIFAMLIVFALQMVTSSSIVPVFVILALVVVAIMAIIFKLPLTHQLEGVRPLIGHDVGGYFMESIFSIIETLLSIFSNTVSFIRVGAFAINHVGLFVAFHTMGAMIGNAAGNVGMIILGNIMIIGLEGLVVFIQGLRLEYYEMFSKYYTGNGVEFVPSKKIFELV